MTDASELHDLNYVDEIRRIDLPWLYSEKVETVVLQVITRFTTVYIVYYTK
jgi:hypothetical protein